MVRSMRLPGLAVVVCLAASVLADGQQTPGPAKLQVERLDQPLGIDDPVPAMSWILSDSAPGARQSAYEVEVATSEEKLAAGSADIWSSGKVSSSQSLNVRYAGPALEPSRRYFWRVKLWGADGQSYTPSHPSWWETGLLRQSRWQGQWIGLETQEEAAVRRARAQWIYDPDAHSLAAEKAPAQRFAYRSTVQLNKHVRQAVLFATGQDTVSAWLNGGQVLTADPLPPWKQMPWKKFVRADVTSQISAGNNILAIEAVHYVVNPNGMVADDYPPMIATLFVAYDDGTTETFGSDAGWKTALHAPAGWHDKTFDDSSWKRAVIWKQPSGSESSSLGNPWIPDSVKALRKEFDLKSSIRSARLYATALGTYELFLNGKRVGDAMFAPGWTDYRQRVVYQTYDVTELVRRGQNAIGALLAPGWYETPLEWFQQPNNYGVTPPALLAQLRVEYNDGTVEWVRTDASWQAHASEILHSELYDGETQDARSATPGWTTTGHVFSNWKAASIFEPAPIAIEAQNFPPVRAEQTIAAVAETNPKPGVYIYDFGQNLVGVEDLRIQGPAGTDVRLRFAEILNNDGTLYTDNLRTAKATDHFILKGGGMEEFSPQFTFHGFRYAEITGLASAPDKSSVSAVVLHTDAPFTAQLTTGSPMLNKLWSNILWGQRSNFVAVPTDCPQRDERLGWMADAQVFWRAASYNMDLAAFSRKFSADMRGTQVGTALYGIYSPGTSEPNTGYGAGWSDAGIVIPWTAWLQTGDASIIEQNWDAMKKYLNAIAAANSNGLWQNQNGTPFGDWLSPEGQTNYVLIATAYWAYDLTLMRQMALATGRTADAEEFGQRFAKIRDAFQKKFVHDDGFVAGTDNSASPFGQINNPDARSSGGDTQTGYVLALHMNLLPEELRPKAAKRLAEKIEANRGLLGTGFLGTPYLLEELTKSGQTDLAFKLLLNTQYPSWGYLVEHGATTMWERWNGDQMKSDPSMNSYNHYAYGAVDDWIYRYVAGIDATPLDAGFHTVVLHPTFSTQLGSTSFDYESAYGPIHSDWTLNAGKGVWHLTLPANTTGWLDLSAVTSSGYKIDDTTLSTSTHAKMVVQDGKSGYELEPGTYTISFH
jgi:alpha-L-rhamnosidase